MNDVIVIILRELKIANRGFDAIVDQTQTVIQEPVVIHFFSSVLYLVYRPCLRSIFVIFCIELAMICFTILVTQVATFKNVLLIRNRCMQIFICKFLTILTR